MCSHVLLGKFPHSMFEKPGAALSVPCNCMFFSQPNQTNIKTHQLYVTCPVSRADTSKKLIKPSNLQSNLHTMLRFFARTLATGVQETPLLVGVPPKYTLASLRSFPSLEPHTMAPYPAEFLYKPLRRDFLWSAVVFEADRARVGAGYVPTKGDKPFSNRKLHPQKGTGRARVGDANSPIRDNGLKAHGIKAPHDWLTKLPRKIYAKAVQTAFSDLYRNGQLFVIGGSEKAESDREVLDFDFEYTQQMEDFVLSHNLERLNLLFITDVERPNLLKATEGMGKKADVVTKEALEVRDILKANRVYIEQDALNWLVAHHDL